MVFSRYSMWRMSPVLVIQDTHGEFVNIYGITWQYDTHCQVTLSEYYELALSFTFMSILCEAVIHNRLQ